MPVDTNDLKLEFINPEFQKNLAGVVWHTTYPTLPTWVLPSGATQSNTTTITSLSNLETGAYTVIDTTGTNGIVYSPTYSIDEPRAWTQFRLGNSSTGPAVTVTLEFLDANNAVLTPPAGPDTSITISAGYNGWITGTLGVMQSTDLNAYRNAVPGAVKVRLRINGVGIYAIKNLFVTRLWATDNADLSADANRVKSAADENPTNAASFCTGIRIRRGNRKNPPLDQLEIGTMEFRLKKINWFGVGHLCRLRALSNGVWETVFQGEVREARKWRDPNGKTDTDDYTEFLIVDQVATLAVTPAPVIKSGNIRQRIQSVLDQFTGTTKLTFNLTGNVTEAPTASPVPLVRADAKMLDQLLTIRNSEMGLLWVDRKNVIQYATSDERRTHPASPVNAPVINFVDKNPAAGEKVVLASGFDRNDLNELEVTWLTFERLGIRASNGESYNVTVGPVANNILPTNRSGHVPVIDVGTPLWGTSGTLANLYLGYWSGGKRAYDSFKWNATKDVATVCKMDIYDRIKLTMTREINDNNVYKDYLIMGLEHEITPGKWMTRVELRAVGTFNTSADSNISNGSLYYTPTGAGVVIPT